MIATASLTLLSLLGSVLLALTGTGSPLAVAHLAFAVGIVPLIFAAMSHFVPVLTRTGDPQRWIRWLPGLAQGSGLFAVAAMQGLLPRHLLHLAAAVDAVLAAILLGWIVARARRCLGAPHPGWRWYGGALACLLLALLSVPWLLAVPEFYRPLRLLHIHLNTLGLVGLAALGTLPVLLPTVLGRSDPEAAGWLRRRCWPSLLAVLAVALGSAIFWPLALAGALVLASLLLDLAGQWRRRYGLAGLLVDGASRSLLAALLGLLLMLLAGAGHGGGWLTGRLAIVGWAAMFLLPLVTGALSQLLPVWWWPGPSRPERLAMRTCLVASGGWRAALFLSGGLLLLADFPAAGGVLLLAGLALFAVGCIQAVRGRRSTR